MRRSAAVTESDTDHDLLITLVETVKNNHQMVLGKFDDVKTDIMDIRTGSTYTLNDHEKRLRSLEKTSDEVNPVEFANMAREGFNFAKTAKEEQRKTVQRYSVAVAVAVALINMVISIVLGLWPIKH